MPTRKSALIFSVALLILIGGATHAQELIDWINRYRAEAGQDSVIEIADARSVAYEHNALVLEAQKSGHYYGYTGLGQALDRSRVDYDFIAELVIYFPYHEVRWDEILAVYQRSAPHWEDLMSPRYQYMSYNMRHTGTESAITIYMIDRH